MENSLCLSSSTHLNKSQLKEVVNLIIENSQSDYRRLGILMEYVFTSKLKLNIDTVTDLLQNYAKKDIENTYYECVKNSQ